MQLEVLKTRQQFKGNSSLVLQTRDREIIRCCYEQQFLVYEQIERFFFSSTHTQNARRRVAKLMRAGLLYSEIHCGLTKHHLIRVTRIGKSIGQSESPFDVPQSKKVDLATLMHDRFVTDVRLRLKSFWTGTWVPEKALKDKYKQIPDGLFQFEETGSTAAIEVENSLKGNSRFLAILNEWSRVDGVRVVLFIATTKKLFDAIHKRLLNAPPKPAFALVEFDVLLNETPQAMSPRGPLDLFTRRSL